VPEDNLKKRRKEKLRGVQSGEGDSQQHHFLFTLEDLRRQGDLKIRKKRGTKKADYFSLNPGKRAEEV